MPTPGEKLTRVETVLQEVHDDMGELKTETKRTRDRLHKLEGSMTLLITRDTITKELLNVRNKHIDRRIQLLIGIAAVGAIIVPLLTHFFGGS